MKREDLTHLCKQRDYAITTFCVDFGTNKCPNTCYYAKQVSAQFKRLPELIPQLNQRVRLDGQ